MDWQGYWSVSDILNHLYCGRITWWWHVMGVPQRGTVKTEDGQHAHDEWSRREAQRRYEGADLRVRRKLVGLRLSSERLGLAGTLDALVTDEDRMLPWDIRNTVEPAAPWRGQVVQMGAYSLLLEHALRAPPVSFGVVHENSTVTTQTATHTVVFPQLRATLRQRSQRPPRQIGD
ncbi:MAG: CRISPR-associated protein Cas4 [Egibacteraceae bacterium]